MDYTWLISGWLMALYGIANGAYAIGWPDRWYTARWTSTSGLRGEFGRPTNSPGLARFFGVVSLVIGVVAAYMVGATTIEIVATLIHGA